MISSVLKQAVEDLQPMARGLAEADTAAWIRAGLPRGSGLPIKEMARQIVLMRDELADIFSESQRNYAAYVHENPPPVLKADEETRYRSWLEDITIRRQWWDNETRSFQTEEQKLTSAFRQFREEAIGTGAVSAQPAIGGLAPGFSSLTQAQARVLVKELASLETSENLSARMLFLAVKDRATGYALSAYVLRDGAGRAVAAASYHFGDNVALSIEHMGALEQEIPGTSVQLIREMAKVAEKAGKSLIVNAAPGSESVFAELGFQLRPAGMTLDGAAIGRLAAGLDENLASWARVGFMEGPTSSWTFKTGDPFEIDLESLLQQVHGWERSTAQRYVQTALEEAVGATEGATSIAELDPGSARYVRSLRIATVTGPNDELLAASLYHLPAGGARVMELDLLGKKPGSAPGIGRFIMRNIAVDASERGSGIWLQADQDAIGFYQRIGMTLGGSHGNEMHFPVEATRAFASGLTGPAAGTSILGQTSWELAVAGSQEWLSEHVIKAVVDEISATTHKALINTLVQGLAQGETTMQLEKRVMALGPATFGLYRAERIARTEVITANRMGGLQMAIDEGCTEKEWRSRNDSTRTREWHKAAYGQRVKIDQPFIVYGYKGDPQLLMVPGDYSMGATGDNTINCRCGVKYIKPGVSDAAAMAIQHHDMVGDIGSNLVGVPAGWVGKGDWAPGPDAHWARLDDVGWKKGTRAPKTRRDITPYEPGSIAASTKSFEEAVAGEWKNGLTVYHDLESFSQMDAYASEYKKIVQERLTDRLMNNPDFLELCGYDLEFLSPQGQQDKREIVSEMAAGLVDGWANTSGDSDSVALVIQKAAEVEFGLTGVRETTPRDERSSFMTESLSTRFSQHMEDLPGYRAFVRAQYDETQAMLKEAGIKEVLVYRGGNLPADVISESADWAAGEVNLVQHPLTSWATESSAAAMFMNGGTSGVPAIFATVVPAERIFSTPATGFGCLRENEVVILGGKTEAFALAKQPMVRQTIYSAMADMEAGMLDLPPAIKAGDVIPTAHRLTGVIPESRR